MADSKSRDFRGQLTAALIGFVLGTAAASLYLGLAGSLAVSAVLVCLIVAAVLVIIKLTAPGNDLGIYSALGIVIGILVQILVPDMSLLQHDPVTGLLLVFFFVFHTR